MGVLEQFGEKQESQENRKVYVGLRLERFLINYLFIKRIEKYEQLEGDETIYILKIIEKGVVPEEINIKYYDEKEWQADFEHLKNLLVERGFEFV